MDTVLSPIIEPTIRSQRVVAAKVTKDDSVTKMLPQCRKMIKKRKRAPHDKGVKPVIYKETVMKDHEKKPGSPSRLNERRLISSLQTICDSVSTSTSSQRLQVNQAGGETIAALVASATKQTEIISEM